MVHAPRLLAVMLSMAITASFAAAQTPQTQPTTQAASPDRERFDRLIALVADQNSPEARRTGVRELLLADDMRALAVPHLARILAGPNPAAATAVADVLAEFPEYLQPEYLAPLTSMLANPDQGASAAIVLAAYADDAGIEHLRAFVGDQSMPIAARLQVVDVLGGLGRRSVVTILVGLLDSPEAPLQERALRALGHATGMTFDNNPRAARTWWLETQESLPLTEWQQRQIQRLVLQDRRRTQSMREMETRLIRALRTAFQRTPEAERDAVLNGYLSESLGVVQSLGLELVQAQQAEGKTLSPDTCQAVRALLSAPETVVRAGAIRAVTSFRDPTDAATFATLLEAEVSPEVRAALVSGLGYIGTADVVPSVLALLEHSPPRLQAEILTALGRLAERDMLDDDTRPGVVAALVATFDATEPGSVLLRERALWAMGRVADPAFLPALAGALGAEEAAGVRHAALRGLAAIGDRSQADLVVGTTSDADVGLRRQAVELLAQWATSDEHVKALFDRLPATQEPDEAIRNAAWLGIERALTGRPPEAIDRWIAQLPDDGETRAKRTLDLLRLQREQLDAQQAAATSGNLSTRIAEQHVLLGNVEEAIAAYQDAVVHLHAADGNRAARVAVELVRLALAHARYTPELAAQLRALNPALDGAAVWNGLGGEITVEITADTLDAVLTTLRLLREHPPVPTWPDEATAALESHWQQAVSMRVGRDIDQAAAALAALQANPEDASAQTQIAELTPRLSADLRAVIAGAEPNAALEQRLHDLLKQLVPEWSGFAADAPPNDKLKALESLPANSTG